MQVNSLLAEMNTNDLGRRYANTFVKYDDSIIFIDSFIEQDNKILVVFTNMQGRSASVFNYKLLDCERPQPRWFINRKIGYYLNYSFERQWHRGFCRNNTTVRNHSGIKVPFDNSMFGLLERFYSFPKEIKQFRAKDLQSSLEKELVVCLSPQVLMYKVGSDVGVNYRERFIGTFGKTDALFEQEIKELVPDYENNAPIVQVQVPKSPVSKKTSRRAFQNWGNGGAGQDWVAFAEQDGNEDVPEQPPRPQVRAGNVRLDMEFADNQRVAGQRVEDILREQRERMAEALAIERPRGR